MSKREIQSWNHNYRKEVQQPAISTNSPMNYIDISIRRRPLIPYLIIQFLGTEEQFNISIVARNFFSVYLKKVFFSKSHFCQWEYFIFRRQTACCMTCGQDQECYYFKTSTESSLKPRNGCGSITVMQSWPNDCMGAGSKVRPQDCLVGPQKECTNS